MKRLSGGIDIGRYAHHMIILDEKEQILYQKTLPHHLKEERWGQASQLHIFHFTFCELVKPDPDG